MLFLAFSICLCGREQFRLGQFLKLFSVKLTKKQIKIGQISIYVISAFHKKERETKEQPAVSYQNYGAWPEVNLYRLVCRSAKRMSCMQNFGFTSIVSSIFIGTYAYRLFSLDICRTSPVACLFLLSVVKMTHLKLLSFMVLVALGCKYASRTIQMSFWWQPLAS